MIVAALLAVIFSLAQAAPSPAAGTAVVRGRVVDKASGEPLARALVSLRSVGDHSARQHFTDDRGRFEFLGLVAGSYELRAAAGAHRTTHVAITYGFNADGVGSLLYLKDGEDRSDLVVELPRALAISGRVLDSAGEPLAMVNITVRSRNAGGPTTMRSRSTDDRGAFRVFGLAPGEYVVCTEIRSGPIFGLGTRATAYYLPACYPAATDAVDATPVRVVDVDVDGIEIRMPRTSLREIRGAVITPSGAPPENASISLTRLEESGASGTTTRLQPGGLFTISNVRPGSYYVAAQTGRGSWQDDDREPQWGSIPVEVTTSDVDGLLIVLKPGAVLRGRVTYEDPPDRPGRGPLRVVQGFGRTAINRPGGRAATVAEDGTFELSGLFGEVALSVEGQPPGYVVKSVRYRGRDITHVPTEFESDPGQPVDIVLTNRTAQLSGRVLDETGKPVAQAVIVRFPADPARWKGFRDWHGANVYNGSFGLTGLTAGDHLIAAVSRDDYSRLSMPDDIERLAPVAERVTVTERDRRTLDLRVTTIPPRRRQ